MSDSEKHTILIIEDEASVADVESRMLRRAGYKVEVSTTGAEGLERIKRGGIDLVILDHQLPDMKGTDIVEALGETLQSLPIVSVTGQGDDELATEMLKLGVTDYLPKGADSSFFKMLPRIVRNSIERFAFQLNERNLQEQIKGSEDTFRRTFEAIPDPALIFEQSADKTIWLARINRAYSGLSMNDSKPGNGGELNEFNNFSPYISEMVKTVFETSTAQHKEVYTGLFKDHEKRWFTFDCVKFKENGALLITRDVTIQKQAEKTLLEAQNELESRVTERTAELKESEEKYRNVIERANDGIIIIQNELIRYANPRLEEITGFRLDEAINIPFNDFIHPDMHEISIELSKKRAAGLDVPAIYESAIRHKDGRRIDVEFNNGVITYLGKPAYLVLVRDISGRKQAEQEKAMIEAQIRHMQKMEAVGTLAAGIAHEINTPAQYVGGNLEFLEDAFEKMDVVFESFKQIKEKARSDSNAISEETDNETEIEAAELELIIEEIPFAIKEAREGMSRLTKIVSAMKEFAHPGKREKTSTDINAAIESTITVSRNEWKYVADLKTDFDSGLPLIPCLRDEFNQTILNIIINASHAIADSIEKSSKTKGVITISTHSQDGWVEIRISDTGPGIPEEIRNRIFDPFYTTKDIGKGTGQGLAITHSAIVDKHDGTVTFETEMGKGTTFVIRLPIK